MAAKTAHTPGPWAAGRLSSCGTVQVEDATGRSIAQAWDWPEAEANAHLIAAAPDLLQAALVLQQGLRALGMATPTHLDLGVELMLQAVEKACDGKIPAPAPMPWEDGPNVW